MKKPKRDLLVLFKTDVQHQQSLDEAVECLHQLLVSVETDGAFCTAHELVARNRITHKRRKILAAIEPGGLKPFYFLVNKN